MGIIAAVFLTHDGGGAYRREMKPGRPLLSLAGVTLLGAIATFNEITPDAHTLLADGGGETAQSRLQMPDAAGQERLAPSRPEGRPRRELPSQRTASSIIDAAPPRSAGNPLSKLSLVELASTRERPIFSPSRRPPPAPTPTHVAPATVRPPVKPPELEHPAVSLVGTVIGTDVHIGVFVETATKNVVRLRVGEDHQGWVLRLIEAGEVTLVKDGVQVVVLRLPPPGEAPDGLPRVATGVIPLVSNENYVDEQPLRGRAPQRR